METIKKYNTGYTQILNDVLYDKNISLRAKGIYAYLFSKPDGWEFHISSMEKELRESRGQIYSAIKELICFEYIKRYQTNENGVFGGIIYEFIDVRNRNTDIPCAEKPVYGKTPSHNNNYILNNTDNINNTYNKNKEIYKESFEEFWKYYPKQRAGSKEKAYKSYYKAISENKITIDGMLESVIKYSQSDEVKRGFAKGCAAWINDDRYYNQYEENKKSSYDSTYSIDIPD